MDLKTQIAATFVRHIADASAETAVAFMRDTIGQVPTAMLLMAKMQIDEELSKRGAPHA